MFADKLQIGLNTEKLGTRERSWLRNYATSRKVADSILDVVIGFFKLT
jgi:hypothetical protein